MLFYLQSDFFTFVPGELESDGIDGEFYLKLFNGMDGAGFTSALDCFLSIASRLSCDPNFGDFRKSNRTVRDDELGRDGFFELVFNYADGRFQIFTLQMLDGSVDEAFTAFQALCFKYEALNPV